jgi:hypothetical protein
LFNFLTTAVNVLSYRGFFACLITAYPAIVPRTPEFYESLLQDDAMAGYAVQLIHEVAKACSDIVAVIATPALTRRLLQIASMPALASFFSLFALAIVKKFAGKTEIHEVVQEFEPAFASVVGLRDCRLPVLLSLFPRRITLHIADFLCSRTSTMYDLALLEVLRSIDGAEFAAVVARPGVLAAAMAALGADKLAGHITDFLRILSDRRAVAPSLQTVEWSEFAEGTLLPHLRRVSVSYGGPYGPITRRIMALSPSAELMQENPTTDCSSSSGSESDEETVGIRRASSGPCSILRQSCAPPLLLISDFDYVAGAAVARSDTQINESQIPAFAAGVVPTERRARTRNAGSVTVADIPKALRT